MGAHQVLDKIDLGTAEEFEGDGVNQYAGAVPFDDEVVVGASVIEAEVVLVAGAAAAIDGDAKHHAFAFGGRQSDNSPSCARTDSEIWPVDHCIQGKSSTGLRGPNPL